MYQSNFTSDKDLHQIRLNQIAQKKTLHSFIASIAKQNLEFSTFYTITVLRSASNSKCKISLSKSLHNTHVAIACKLCPSRTCSFSELEMKL